jgi:hypothetical protein
MTFRTEPNCAIQIHREHRQGTSGDCFYRQSSQQGDLTLGFAAKGGNLQAFEVLIEGHEQRKGLGEVFSPFGPSLIGTESLVCRSSHSNRSEQEVLEASAEAVKQHIAASDGSR